MTTLLEEGKSFEKKIIQSRKKGSFVSIKLKIIRNRFEKSQFPHFTFSYLKTCQIKFMRDRTHAIFFMLDI